MTQERPTKSPREMSPVEALRRIEAHARSAQAELAERADAGEDVLHYLAVHGKAATRRAVAANPGAGARSNRLLADDREEDVRAELARKIGRLLPTLLAVEREHLRALTIATLERLARDQVINVRAILADAIKELDCVPKEVVTLLARDIEAVVSAPIIEFSPLLSDRELLEIIAGAQSREAIAAVARRKRLSAKVSHAVAETLDVPAIAALLMNTRAQLRKSTLDRIVVGAARVSEWHSPLTLRPELSSSMIRRLATFVGVGLIEALVSRRGLDETVRAELTARLTGAVKDENSGAYQSADNPADEVEAALGTGKLDDSFVEEAAIAGQRETVILALAKLAGIAASKVREIMASGSAKAMTALVWRAGLSMRTAFKIQSLIMKLKGPNLLPARSGLHFPLTDEEMRWHLSYFDIRN